MTNFLKIRAQVLTAYSDCHNIERFKDMDRNLKFKASKWVNGEEFKAIMKAAVPDGYNEFGPEIVDKLVEFFGESSQYIIAREGSPCVYVKPKDKTKDIPMWPLRVDEISYNVATNTFRLWWD